jgi:hypothetical protein
MKTNVGIIDRALRVIVGLGIVAAGIFYQSWWGLAGIVPLATAFAGWCPLYLPFGISTRRKPRAEQPAGG